MDKEFATRHLGGSEKTAAHWLGMSPAAYHEWPERLWPKHEAIVYGTILMRDAALAMGVKGPDEFRADPRNRAFLESLVSRISLMACTVAVMDPIPPHFLKGVSAPVPRDKRSKRKHEDAEAAAISAG